jgi:hypothetical protein
MPERALRPSSLRAPLRRGRGLPAIVAACALALASTSTAHAQATPPAELPPPPPPPAGFVPPPPPGFAVAPGPGAMPFSATPVFDFDAAIDSLQEQRKAAERQGDEARAEMLEQELDRLKRARKEHARATTKRRSTGLMVGGIVLSGVGGVTLICGLIFTLAGSAQDQSANGRKLQTVGGIMLGGSALAIGAGIPMAVVGGKKVPRDDVPQPSAHAEPRGITMRYAF